MTDHTPWYGCPQMGLSGQTHRRCPLITHSSVGRARITLTSAARARLLSRSPPAHTLSPHPLLCQQPPATVRQRPRPRLRLTRQGPNTRAPLQQRRAPQRVLWVVTGGQTHPISCWTTDSRSHQRMLSSLQHGAACDPAHQRVCLCVSGTVKHQLSVRLSLSSDLRDTPRSAGCGRETVADVVPEGAPSL